MTYFCFDFGLKRIGIAASTSGIMAHPVCVLPNRGDAKNIAAIRDVIRKTTTGGVVCGDILLLVGDGGGAHAVTPHSNAAPHVAFLKNQIRHFGELLAREFSARVVFCTEDFSSRDAEEYIRGTMNVRDPKKVKELLDAVAATMILNNYLGAHNG